MICDVNERNVLQDIKNNTPKKKNSAKYGERKQIYI